MVACLTWMDPLRQAKFRNQVRYLAVMIALNTLGVSLLFWCLRTGSRTPLYALILAVGYNLLSRLVTLSKVKPWAPRCKGLCGCGCGRSCFWALGHEGKHES